MDGDTNLFYPVILGNNGFNSRSKNAIFKYNPLLMSTDIFHSHEQQAVFRRYLRSCSVKEF